MPNDGNATRPVGGQPPVELWGQLYAQLTAAHQTLVDSADGYDLGPWPYTTGMWLRGCLRKGIDELVAELGVPA